MANLRTKWENNSDFHFNSHEKYKIISFRVAHAAIEVTKGGQSTHGSWCLCYVLICDNISHRR